METTEGARDTRLFEPVRAGLQATVVSDAILDPIKARDKTQAGQSWEGESL